MSSPVIEFSEVTKVYRRGFRGQDVAALSGVSFEVYPGEVCAFLGPNGAGKTTSISILMGFVFEDSGEIRVFGHRPGDVRAKKWIGFVPENFAFYKHMTATRLLEFHRALAGPAEGGAVPEISDLLARVKLDTFEKLRIAKYSRGMVQRLGIAQALLDDPQLLILDEPTSGLDPAGRKEIRNLMLSLKGAGKTIFLSSHILSEIEQVCDRVIIIDRGRLIRAGLFEEMRGQTSQVELVVDALPEHVEQELRERGAEIERGPQSVHVTVAAAQKRETAETLWTAGCDVVQMNPKKTSLEELFLRLLEPGGGAL
jgi:ABC-2 type transport system ATP-binding protein